MRLGVRMRGRGRGRGQRQRRPCGPYAQEARLLQLQLLALIVRPSGRPPCMEEVPVLSLMQGLFRPPCASLEREEVALGADRGT